MRISATGSDDSGWRRDRGFSLLELILVMIVISLVAVITYPSLLRGRTAFHLRAVSRDVINTMRFARETAVTEQKVMVANIDSQAQTITVSDEVGDGARTYAPPADVKLQGLSGAGEAAPAEGPLTIRFLPNGSSEDAQIVLRSDTGATMSIVLDAITGGARVRPEQGGRIP